MYDMDELKKLYDRLKVQYPKYGENFTLTLLYAKVEVNRTGCRIFVNEKLYDQLSSEEIDDIDDLYELIEAFLLQIQHIGMTSGNETYITANNQAVHMGTRALLSSAVLSMGCFIIFLLTKDLLYLILVFLCPAGGYLYLRLMRQKAFYQYWVCPGCGQNLPLDKKSRFPQMEYVSQCPHCGRVLEKVPEMEPVRLEPDAPKRQLEPDNNPPAAGKKWPCTLTGYTSAVVSLFLFVILFFAGDPLAPQNTAIELILLLIWFSSGLILLLHRHREPEDMLHKPVVVLREQKKVTGVGIFLWLLGSVFLFMAVAVASAVPVDGSTIFLGAIGVFVTFFGVWMLLAGRNRSMFVFQDHSVLYISSLGRQKKLEAGQVASVRLTVNRSIQLLDANGKKLVSVETNMQGASRLAEWIESTDLAALLTPAMERQTAEQVKEESILQWREEYRTHWHDHLKTISTGLWVVMILYLVGVISPIPLYLFAGVKFRTTMALAAISPIPFLIFCIVSAPVIIFGDRPKNATAEWNSMHIRLSLPVMLFPALAMLWQVHYIWSRSAMQPKGSGEIWIIQGLLIAVPVISLCLYRTPKGRRFETGFFVILVSMSLGMSISYCANAALCGPARHYKAVIVDSHKEDPNTKGDDNTLTVLLDDGSEEKIHVSDSIYEMAIKGEALDVCHSESPLGMEMLKIHLPKTQ
ncbi:MAG: hypothetical protein ACLTWG_00840 [Blautia sp.]|uniref:hypothetical protein n=1 Tax=Blautia sp. TaxID=1955243 RepID=UPI003996C85A